MRWDKKPTALGHEGVIGKMPPRLHGQLWKLSVTIRGELVEIDGQVVGIIGKLVGHLIGFCENLWGSVFRNGLGCDNNLWEAVFRTGVDSARTFNGRPFFQMRWILRT